MNPILLSYNSIVRNTDLYNSHHNEVKAAKIAMAKFEMNFLIKCDPALKLEDQQRLLERLIDENDGYCTPLLREPENANHEGESVEPPVMTSVCKVLLGLSLAGSLLLEAAARNDASDTLHDMANRGEDSFDVTGRAFIDEEAESSGNESEVD